MVKEMSATDLKHRLAAGADLVLLDVREPEELALAALPGAMHIPMNEVPGRLHELDPEKEIVVFCHHGIRSAMVVQLLTQHDFERAVNLEGGIDAWSLAVDSNVARY